MEKKPINEYIKDERDREIDRKASQNARIAEGFAAAIIVIASLICKESFVGWIVLSVYYFSETVEAVTKYYHYREKPYIGKIVLCSLLLISAAFLAVSGILGR